MAGNIVISACSEHFFLLEQATQFEAEEHNLECKKSNSNSREGGGGGKNTCGDPRKRKKIRGIKNGGRRGYHPMPITFSRVFLSFLFRVGFTRE